MQEIGADLRSLEDGGATGIRLLSKDGDCLSQGIALPFILPDMRGYYLYALTTKKSARGQGHMRTLLRESGQKAKEQGFSFLFLLPDGDALAAFYRTAGFCRAYPAGASPCPLNAGDFYYRTTGSGSGDETSRPGIPDRMNGPAPSPAEFGSPLSPALFAFTLSTMACVRPIRTAAGAALVFAGDPRCVMAFPKSAAASYTQSPQKNPFLLQSLDGKFPARLPEPLPR